MQNLKNVYRRYAFAFATASTAACIGFVMQTSEAAVVSSDQEGIASADLNGPVTLPKDVAVPHLGTRQSLPSMPADVRHATSLPQQQVLVAVADDLPVGLLPNEEQIPALGCGPELRAEPSAAALVSLQLIAPCHPNERVLIEHEDLAFHAEVSREGSAELIVPALSETAVFAATFANGDGAVASARIDALPLYDRVVMQWRGEAGPELHAREFGAFYGESGHVWREAPRNVSALVGGNAGFLLSLGAAGGPQSAQAEIYTFPSGISSSQGEIQISIEAAVTEANCDQEVRLTSLGLTRGEVSVRHELEIQMPDCTAVGEFLVLKNLVQNLTIAQN
ncbi:translocase [Shimia sp. R10_1]|uniref:translocase n=1 Tax=Shimia sp. R10_1 TaxID=2821095 RepID=UPI001ADCF0B4|nr:translocase [Shimia sp. R10_1]MBO9473188.1 translocase [Shimia sp. R10_1]